MWVPETWAQDALTQLGYLAGQTTSIRLGTSNVQLGARSPALVAMSAMSLQLLSGGRFLLGIGVSGPQVMEGWHGVRFRRPVQTTRETIEIVRTVARGDRLKHDGRVYRLPLPDGPGRALRSPLPPTPVPIYVAALGPRNLELTGELADGWIGNMFMPEHAHVFLDRLSAGAARAGRRLADLDLVIPVAVEFTEDADAAEAAARRHADGYAFTIGAMGSRDQNFYNDALTRLGFGDDVRAVQELWLAGQRDRRRRAGARTEIVDARPTCWGRRTWSPNGSGCTATRASPRCRPSWAASTPPASTHWHSSSSWSARSAAPDRRRADNRCRQARSDDRVVPCQQRSFAAVGCFRERRTHTPRPLREQA